VDYIFNYAVSELAEGRSFSIENFGTFSLKQHKTKRFFNPMTGKMDETEAKVSIRFHPHDKVNNIINGDKK